MTFESVGVRAVAGLVSVCAGLVFVAAASAAYPEAEYGDQIKVHEEVEPIGENPFGEAWNPYTGAYSADVGPLFRRMPVHDSA